ncbi:phage minor head protein [Klebsiella oxytoca]|uniref:phage head morphogenesis protein n=1 Tax=Klebsiella oxytoca TaxID=571 RepID=UPI003A93C44B
MKIDRAQIKNLFFNMTPESALRWLNNKGARITADDYNTLRGNAVAYSFRLANLTRFDIAQDILNALREHLADGKTMQSFVEQLEPVLKNKGWWGYEEKIDTETGEILSKELGTPRRLKLIYHNMMMSAYNSGRYESLIQGTKTHPFWRYNAIDDGATRINHLVLNNLVFASDDLFWSIFFPPNGFGCRCSVSGVTAEQVKRDGLLVCKTLRIISREAVIGKTADNMPLMGTVQGCEVEFPDGSVKSFFPDVGFDRNSAQDIWRTNIDKYDPELSRAYIEVGLNGDDLSAIIEHVKKGNVYGQSIPAAVIDDADLSLLNVRSKTAWLNDNNLAAQYKAGTLLEQNELVHVQSVIESAPVVIRNNGQIELYSVRDDGGLYRAIVDNKLNIIAFEHVPTLALDIALITGDVLRFNTL